MKMTRVKLKKKKKRVIKATKKFVKERPSKKL